MITSQKIPLKVTHFTHTTPMINPPSKWASVLG